MSNEPILLLLHGVGQGDRDGTWQATCSEALVRLGYPDLENVQVIAPQFAHALKGVDEPRPLPPVTTKQLSREAAKKNRRGFERRMGAIEFRLGRPDRGQGRVGGDAAVRAAYEHLKAVEQAKTTSKIQRFARRSCTAFSPSFRSQAGSSSSATASAP
ncbi:hypothetical protein [Sanguibacter suarezii]|uniref:hypothetical protein n=1 Tax=Sanguibacter suarezii TaxID=60921 RepID=UPI00082B13B3|nr:hypothetical protein [Sanguibacter suarezii]